MEITLTNSNFNEEVLKSDIPVLVDFWATWCGPCMMMSPIVEEIAKEFDGKIKVGKINVDEEDELASEYEIYSIPTLMLFKNGEKVGQLIKKKKKDDLINFINEK